MPWHPERVTYGPAGRLLTLLSLLQTPREWPGSELAERLGVSHRTIRRDVDRLRELGYPVEATMGSIGGYRLVAGRAMPPLLLDDEEAVAIAVGLRTAAGQAVDGIEEASVRALTKLQHVLPSRLRQRVNALGAATTPLLADTSSVVDAEELATIATAVTSRERLRFAYESTDGSPSRRLVEPHSLVPTRRRWYLVAFDNDRDDWRIFRVDRMKRAERTGLRITPRVLPAADAAAYVASKLFDRSPTYRAIVTLHAPIRDARRIMGRVRADLDRIDEHSCRLHTRADSLEWIAFRLMMLNCDFEVHQPAELTAHIERLATRLTRAVTRSAGQDGVPLKT
jgi:predicted DNA-binding transcriptional regulator YafY